VQCAVALFGLISLTYHLGSRAKDAPAYLQMLNALLLTPLSTQVLNHMYAQSASVNSRATTACARTTARATPTIVTKASAYAYGRVLRNS
jgi:hypothetical protein